MQRELKERSMGRIRSVKFKLLGDYNLKQHFGSILVFFGMAVATTIYTHIDSVMLGVMVSAEQVGYYNAAVKIKTLLVSFVATLGTVLLPRVSYYYQNGFEKEFFEVCRKSVNFVLILAASLMVYFMLYASDTIYFLAGEDYEMAIKPMVVIMPTLLLIGITNVTGLQILVPMGQERAVLASEIAGAVVGTLTAEAAVLVVQVAALREKRQNFFIGIQYWKIVTALIAAIATYPLINMCTISGFCKIMISGCIFYVVYMLVLNITKEKMTMKIP